VISRGIVAEISDTTIWRWLSADALRPWAHRSWIFPRDPHFVAKAGPVLDLYARRWAGRRLHHGDFVLSADEKTSIQARCRCHPTLPTSTARAMRVEHEYVRGGAVQYLAAWDCHRAKVFGRCELRTAIEPFGRLVDQVMAEEPYRSARRVFWVVDNGSSHRGHKAAERLRERHRNLRLVHTPVHSSWLNQVEIYILDRAAQGAHPERLHRSGRGAAPTGRIRTPIRAGRFAVRVEVHPRRPRGRHEATRGEASQPSRRVMLLSGYVTELSTQRTKRPADQLV
jgi:hypothetical protein